MNTEYVSLGKDRELIIRWLSDRNTLDYISIWEGINNQNFDNDSYNIMKKYIGLSTFIMTPDKWIAETKGIAIFESKGIHAHNDLYIHFQMWLDPNYSLKIIKEYQELKAISKPKELLDFRGKLKKALDYNPKEHAKKG